MWLAFEFFPNMFESEVIDYNSGEYIKEKFCTSSIQCAMIFWSNGLFDGGTDELMDMVSFRKNPGRFVGLFFYNFFAFVLIDTIFANIFTGCITDAFAAHREKTEAKIYARDNKCFICDLDREEAVERIINFEKHKKEHNIEQYIEFLIYLFTKNYEDHTLYERNIYSLIYENDISWVPIAGKNEG